MKTTLRFNSPFLSLFTAFVILMSGLTAKAQTYTTISNGAWNLATTWQGGSIPNAANIPAGAVVNIRHIVTFVGTAIVNNGTIRIENSSLITPRLVVPTGVTFTNNVTGNVIINNAEYRQYRFVGGLQTGVAQSGKFVNNGGKVTITNSFVEVAQDWENANGGTIVFRFSSLVIGRNYDQKSNAIDTLDNTSVSLGMHGNGGYLADGLRTYYNYSRFQVASSGGKFELKGGTINGNINYITLKNHITNTISNDDLLVNSNVNTTGLTLDSYCVLDASKYKPNGKFSNNPVSNCSLNYFPAGLIGTSQQARLNLSENPTLISGSDKLVGATYRYIGAAPGMDVIVRIDSIVNNAQIIEVDVNTSGYGFSEGFQPRIRAGNVGLSYAVFSFSNLVTGTSVPHSMTTFSLTALDIDGSSALKEFNEINMGAGSVLSYFMGTPALNMTVPSANSHRGMNQDGATVSGIDTTALQYMFTVTNTNVSNYSVKMGVNTTSASSEIRRFSFYSKGFAYPEAATLPVKLFSFNATLNKNKKAELKWTSVMEENLSHYLVERSFDGQNYSEAGLVFAAGNSNSKINYNLNDDVSQVQKGMVYYRLKMVDDDGSFAYSDIRVIRIGEQSQNVNIMTYPNPVISDVRVTIPASWQNQVVTYQIFSGNGQVVMSRTNASASQTEVFNLSNLGPGFYIVKASNGTEAAQQKIIKR